MRMGQGSGGVATTCTRTQLQVSVDHQHVSERVPASNAAIGTARTSVTPRTVVEAGHHEGGVVEYHHVREAQLAARDVAALGLARLLQATTQQHTRRLHKLAPAEEAAAAAAMQVQSVRQGHAQAARWGCLAVRP